MRTLVDTLKRGNSEPTRHFRVGEQVRVGALQNVRIKEIHEGGKAYTTLHDYVWTEDCGRQKHESTYDNEVIRPWYDIYPIEHKDTSLQDDFYDVFIRTQGYNRHVGGLLHDHYSGINYDAPYQRDYCWTLEQKQELIDSMYKGRRLGMVVLRKKPYPELPECIDGKQRTKALVDFYEGRFKYKGYYIHELSPKDRYIFTEHPIQTVEVELTDKEVLQYFLTLNFAGVPQSKEHLEKVQQMLEEVK